MSFASNQSPIRLSGVTRGKVVIGGGIKRGGFTMYGGTRRKRNKMVLPSLYENYKVVKTSDAPSSKKNSDSAVTVGSSIAGFMFLLTFAFLILTLAIGWIVVLVAFAAPLIVVIGFLGLFAVPFVALTPKK